MKKTNDQLILINAYAGEIKKVSLSNLISEKSFEDGVQEVMKAIISKEKNPIYFPNDKFDDTAKVEFGLNYLYSEEYFYLVKEANDLAQTIDVKDAKKIIEFSKLVSFIAIRELFENEQDEDAVFAIPTSIVFHVAFQMYALVKLGDKIDISTFSLIASNAMTYMYKMVYDYTINNAEKTDEEKQGLISVIPEYVGFVVDKSVRLIKKYLVAPSEIERQNLSDELQKKIMFTNFKSVMPIWWSDAMKMNVDFLGEMINLFEQLNKETKNMN